MNSQFIIKVSLVEDDAGLRESMARLLDKEPGFRCASAHASASQAVAEIPAVAPDVVLMDLKLGKGSGVECIQQLKGLRPRIQILVLTMYEDADLIFQSLMAGASGYLLKRSKPDEILQAIREVHAGGAPMSRQIARKVVSFFQHQKIVEEDIKSLSKREYEVLLLLSEGLAYKEIADRCGISLETVRGHIRKIYDKLHVHSRTEAVMKLMRQHPPYMLFSQES